MMKWIAEPFLERKVPHLQRTSTRIDVATDVLGFKTVEQIMFSYVGSFFAAIRACAFAAFFSKKEEKNHTFANYERTTS